MRLGSGGIHFRRILIDDSLPVPSPNPTPHTFGRAVTELTRRCRWRRNRQAAAAAAAAATAAAAAAAAAAAIVSNLKSGHKQMLPPLFFSPCSSAFGGGGGLRVRKTASLGAHSPSRLLLRGSLSSWRTAAEAPQCHGGPTPSRPPARHPELGNQFWAVAWDSIYRGPQRHGGPV
ncbi:unnamed protein product [Lota lota]